MSDNEQQRERMEYLIKYADRLMGSFDEIGRANTENRIEYVRERTYRPTIFILALNSAIISASSFIFIKAQGQINSLSKLLFIGISLSFVSIILELFNRNSYLKILADDAMKRVINADNRRKELEGIMKGFDANEILMAFNKLSNLPPILEDNNSKIIEETTRAIKPVHHRRAIALTCTIISLFSFFAVGLSQLGIIYTLGKFLTAIS